MNVNLTDGGRAAAGYHGSADDCVVRAIAIATERPYQEVYDSLNSLARGMRQTRKVRGSSSRTGINRVVYDRYLSALGWRFVPTMKIGSGCRVHLRADELPAGRLIVRLSRHLTAVIDGVIHDTDDCSRRDAQGLGTRCVYGFYRLERSSD